jgi:hypothetical protein
VSWFFYGCKFPARLVVAVASHLKLGNRSFRGAFGQQVLKVGSGLKIALRCGLAAKALTD